jgi:hypothetical protein
MTTHHYSMTGYFGDPTTQPPAVRWTQELGRFAPLGGASPAIRTQFATVLVCVLPFLALLIQRPPSYLIGQYISFGAWTAACYGMIQFPRLVWNRLRAAAPEADRLFDEDTLPPLANLISDLSSRAKRRQLMAASVTTAGALAIFAPLTLTSAGGGVQWIFLSLILGFLTGHSAYLIGITAYFCRRVHDAEHLRLDPFLPIRTPGLVAVSRAIRWAIRLMAQLGLVLVVAVTTPLFISYHQHPSLLSLLLRGIGISIALGSVILIGVTSQSWLSSHAVIEKGTYHSELMSRVTHHSQEIRAGRPIAPQDLEELDRLTAIAVRVTATPDSFTDPAIVSAYAASLLGVGLQIVLAVVLTGR